MWGSQATTWCLCLGLCPRIPTTRWDTLAVQLVVVQWKVATNRDMGVAVMGENYLRRSRVVTQVVAAEKTQRIKRRTLLRPRGVEVEEEPWLERRGWRWSWEGRRRMPSSSLRAFRDRPMLEIRLKVWPSPIRQGRRLRRRFSKTSTQMAILKRDPMGVHQIRKPSFKAPA